MKLFSGTMRFDLLDVQNMENVAEAQFLVNQFNKPT